MSGYSTHFFVRVGVAVRPALVKVYVQPTYILQSTIATALKLGTLVHHHISSVYAKIHNSNLHFDEIIALF